MYMRILHTADWHLGCKTDDMSRMEEQKDALRQIIKISKERDVDVVIIAGDIYDSFLPSSEAEDVFYKTVKELNNDGDTIVIAIAGNHDDPKRLENASVFANNYGIFLIGHLDQINLGDISTTKGRKIRAIESGKGYLVLEKSNGEKAVVAYLPYPTYYRFNEKRNEEVSYSDRVQEWLSNGLNRFEDNTVNIVASHLLTYSSKIKANDFKELSVIENSLGFVSNDALFTDAQYTALGHIHSCVPVNRDRNIYYCGSLINQTFDANSESLTKVIVADINHKGVQKLDKVPLDVKLLKKFTVKSMLQAEIVCRDNPDSWVKVEVEGVDGITIDEIKELRSKYKNLVTLAIITKEARNTKKDFVSKKDLTNAEIFDNFALRQTGEPADPDVKELFLSLMSEELYETD